MKIITVDSSNIDSEHICCAISEKTGENCVGSKKAWLRARFEDGLVFKKLDARGKVFIEYMPAEKCFSPVDAKNYMFINCLWVSGKFKSQGLANQLLDECIKDAKKKKKLGLVALGSKKKMHFLTDPEYLKYKGFKIADTASPNFELLYLPFKNTAPIPTFKDSVKDGEIPHKGISIYYSNGCPHTDKYIPLQRKVLEERSVAHQIIHLTTPEEAQKAPTPCTIFSLFIDGKFITSEILTEKRLNKFLDDNGYK